MTRHLQAVLGLLRRERREGPHVHFHQGSHGQPAPCFDERCPNPRLSP